MTSPAQGRLAGFDVLRAAGAFAVVWIHACDTSGTARRLSGAAGFAVPCFILMSFFLLQRGFRAGAGERPLQRLGRRVARLLPAYAGWTAIYLAVRFARHAVAGGALEPDWLSWLCFGGASYQLYFVPALVYWSVLFLPLLAWAASAPRGWAVGGLLLVSVLVGAGAAWLTGTAAAALWPFGLRQTVGLAWLVPLAAAFAVAAPQGWRPRGDALRPWAVWGAVGLVLALGASGRLGGAAFALGVTLPLFGLALLDTGRPVPAWVGRLAALSFGIYLSHGLFVEGLQAVAGWLGVGLASLPRTLAVIGAAFAGSWALCEVLDRWRGSRWLIR